MSPQPTDLPGYGHQVLTLAQAHNALGTRPLARRTRNLPARPAAAPALPAPASLDPMTPAAQRHLGRVLDNVLATAEAVTGLPPVCAWTIHTVDQLHDRQPTICGQLDGGLFGGEREAIARWAAALGGEVAEVPGEGYISVEALVRVAGTLVVVWGHAYDTEVSA